MQRHGNVTHSRQSILSSISSSIIKPKEAMGAHTAFDINRSVTHACTSDVDCRLPLKVLIGHDISNGQRSLHSIWTRETRICLAEHAI